MFSLRHYKCTDHTSSKNLDVSPDIIPSEIDKNFKINYPNYSRSTLYAPLCKCLKTRIKDEFIRILYLSN